MTIVPLNTAPTVPALRKNFCALFCALGIKDAYNFNKKDQTLTIIRYIRYNGVHLSAKSESKASWIESTE